QLRVDESRSRSSAPRNQAIRPKSRFSGVHRETRSTASQNFEGAANARADAPRALSAVHLRREALRFVCRTLAVGRRSAAPIDPAHRLQQHLLGAAPSVVAFVIRWQLLRSAMEHGPWSMVHSITLEIVHPEPAPTSDLVSAAPLLG